jgi:hypothetical protein
VGRFFVAATRALARRRALSSRRGKCIERTKATVALVACGAGLPLRKGRVGGLKMRVRWRHRMAETPQGSGCFSRLAVVCKKLVTH